MNRIYRVVCFSAFAGALAWLLGPSLYELVIRWSSDPAYSHGFLVPVFAVYLLVRRRGMAGVSSPAVAWGLGLLGIGALLEIAAGVVMVRTLAHYSLPFFAAGICLVFCGWHCLKWAWPSIVFLFFMVPLPGPLGDLLSHPLQRVATKVATYVVQLIGVPAIAEGNVIVLSEARLGVAEACSGLRMLVSFVTFAVAVVFLVDRKPWEKAVVLLSAVPIAIIANVTRITVTAALYEWVSSELAEAVFHDLAGWLMMPLALALLAGELRLLSALFVEAPVREALPVASIAGMKKAPPKPVARSVGRRKHLRAR
ncbi:MAG TPA: exosortase/archaeosortase family protein [Pirellulales bacterium]